MVVTWEKVDMKTEKIWIENTKSGEDRIVPINSELKKVLESMNNGTPKLFSYIKWWITNKFKKYLKESGIKDWESFNVHSLRHTFASHLIMEGTDLYTVCKLLGYSFVAITQMYAHLAPDYLKISVGRLKF